MPRNYNSCGAEQNLDLRVEGEETFFMNNIIYLVGLVVVVMAVLSFVGLR